MSELPDLSLLTSAQKDELIRQLFVQVKNLSAQISAFSAEVKQLKVQNGKNSSNSHKPPSSDAFDKEKTTSLRKPSGKKPGGQAGHKGHTLRQSNNPTQIIQCPLPGQCDKCGSLLQHSEAQVLQRRQVVDIPIMACDVIEHQTMTLRCQCGKLHVSQFPDNVREAVQYGPNLRALGVELTQWQLLPLGRASRLIQDLFHIQVSSASLLSWVAQARRIVQPEVDRVAENLRHSALAHADESGLRVEGKLHWLHVVATEKYTWYGIHAKRGMEAIKEHGILPAFTGVLVHDCWPAYWELNCTHALCNAHLMRELVYSKEITGQDWPQQMFNFLTESNQIRNAALQQNVPLSAQDIKAFDTFYDGVLREGELLHPAKLRTDGKRGRVKQSVPHNLLKRLRQYSDAVLLFMHEPDVPFTNNEAERTIRMPKVKQRISGCFRALDGAENFAVIRSYLDTLHKQKQSIFQVLRQVFVGCPIQPA